MAAKRWNRTVAHQGAVLMEDAGVEQRFVELRPVVEAGLRRSSLRHRHDFTGEQPAVGDAGED